MNASSLPSTIRLKIWPVFLVTLLLVSALLIDGLISSYVRRFLTEPQIQSSSWILYYAGHAGMFAASLVLIFVMSGGKPQNFGLRLPSGRSYVPAALAWGIIFGVTMTAIDYFPNLLRHAAPNFSLSTFNLVGWLSFEGLFAGTVEEILFRGLLVSYLMSKISGRIRVGGFDLHVGGAIVALLFCLSHIGSFAGRPFGIALAQQVYAFIWAIFYAYWFEKSGSVLAPIIGHNVGNVIEYCLAFLMVWIWR